MTRDEAWERLGVRPQDVAGQPIIGRMLAKIGPRRAIIKLLRESEVPELRAVLAKVMELPDSKRTLSIPMEAFCVAARVPTLRFLGLVIGEALARNADISKLIAAAAHPAVTRKTVHLAMQGSLSAAKMLHQHAGFLPAPKGAVVQIFNRTHIDARSESSMVLPAMEDESRRLTERFHDRFLTSAPAPTLDIETDAELDE